jgi:DNA-binding transcriptional MerR regulator
MSGGREREEPVPGSVPGYTLSQLCEMAEVTSRTVRYYIGQGLLPSPGMGPAAEYTAAHLDRLRLIKRLQRMHLPLAAIRGRLEAMTDEQVAAMLAEPEPPPDSALDYVRAVLSETPAPHADLSLRTVAPSFESPKPPAASPAPSARLRTPSFHDLQSESDRTPGPGRSSWERIALSPDIELHVRRPLSRIQNRFLSQLVAFANKLLREELR